MHRLRTDHGLGTLLCLVAAAAFAVQPILTQLAYADGASVASVLAWRFAIAAPILLVLGRRGLRALRLRTVAVAFVLGAALYGAECALYFASLARLEASVASLVHFGYPALVAAGAVALGRERFSRRRAAALGVALAGIGLVLAGAGGATLDGLGVGLAFGASFAYAAYVLASDRILRGADPIALAAVVCSGAAAAFGGFGAATGSLGDGLGAGISVPLLLVAIGLGCTVLPIAAFLSGVVRVGPSRATVLATAEPPLTILVAWAVLGDRLTSVQLVGAGVVVAALALLQVTRRPRLRLVRRPAPARVAAEPADSLAA